MNLDRIIAVRNNKTVYRDGDRCLKVFNEGIAENSPTYRGGRILGYDLLNMSYRYCEACDTYFPSYL